MGIETAMLGATVYFARMNPQDEKLLDTPAEVVAVYIGGREQELRFLVRADQGGALWDRPAWHFHQNDPAPANPSQPGWVIRKEPL